jgi:hypothetical protein
MKTFRIMCAALVAAMSLASCQKEQEQAPENKTLKSVEVKINNVAPVTRAIGGLGESLEGKNIQLNSLQFFFSDGTSLYEAKDAEGNVADVYYDAAELAALNGSISAKFHFLPAAVKKVIVIGNYSASAATTETALDTELEIGKYQDVTNFPLYAEGTLGLASSNAHDNGSNGHLSNVYTVNLDVYPHVARFEITGIGCTLPLNSGKIVKVVSIAFADFFDKCDFRTAVGHTLRSVQLNQQDIYTYFQEQMSTAKWNNDFFNGLNGQEGAGNSHPIIELTAAKTFVETDIAYNFFCKGAPSPCLLLNVIEYENQAAFDANNGTPGYLYTNVYRLNSTEPVTTFEPGKIYRMAIRFNEDDLQHQERCLDINLNIAEWIVINVTPEF